MKQDPSNSPKKPPYGNGQPLDTIGDEAMTIKPWIIALAILLFALSSVFMLLKTYQDELRNAQQMTNSPAGPFPKGNNWKTQR